MFTKEEDKFVFGYYNSIFENSESVERIKGITFNTDETTTKCIWYIMEHLTDAEYEFEHGMSCIKWLHMGQDALFNKCVKEHPEIDCVNKNIRCYGNNCVPTCPVTIKAIKEEYEKHNLVGCDLK